MRFLKSNGKKDKNASSDSTFEIKFKQTKYATKIKNTDIIFIENTGF